MPLFQCAKCGCVENTALSNYWTRNLTDDMQPVEPPNPPLCTECDPEIAEWHGAFPKRSAVGMVLGADGFLYTDEQFKSNQVRHTTPERIVT
jgi:hypothetical protein